MTRYLLALCVALFCQTAFAATYDRWFPNVNPFGSQPRYATPLEACTYLVGTLFGPSLLPAQAVDTGAGASVRECRDKNNSTRGSVNREQQTLTCVAPLIAKFSNSGTSSGAWSCQTTLCVPGQQRTFNRTMGFSRSPNAGSNLINSTGDPSLTGYNDGVCVGDLVDVVDCWVSQTPTSQGLHRVSCDYTMKIASEAPSGTGDTATNPMTADAICPGFVGEVNGKTVCAGTASQPLPAGTPPPDKPTRSGNPSAGVKPLTGEGSGTGAGRTPSNGNGGNLGGPASAAVGAGGTGTGTRDPGDPEQEGTEVCGAPPLPACNVKVDETGTPSDADASGRFTAATSALDAQTQALEGVIDDASTIQTPGWSWSFSMPTGCTALQMPAFDMELDVCQFQPMIHDLMSFVWVIAGFFAFLGLFRNATTV